MTTTTTSDVVMPGIHLTTYRPLISVVIPTFNRAQQVQVALRSVLAQTYAKFEVIVVDDGSTDTTREVVEQFMSEQNGKGKQIRYFSQTNQGPSAARNKGIAEAKGECIAFLDSDDEWLPEKLEWQLRAIEKFNDKCCACITDARLVDNLGMDTTVFHESGKRYEETLGTDPQAAESLVKTREPFWVSTLLARTDIVKRVGCFDPEIGYAEDHDFLFRLSLATSFCYANMPLSVIDRSKSPLGSICRPWDKVEVRLRGSQAIFDKWLSLDSQLPSGVRSTLVRNLRNVHSAWANWYLEHEQYHEAREAVCKAIKYQFTPQLAIKWALTHMAPGFAKRILPKMRVH
jgi:glycosyltransferase involved in cell wall biosynthesis